MKVKFKSVLSMLILLAFAIIAGGSVDGDDLEIIVLAISIGVVIGCSIFAVKVRKIGKNEKEKELERKRQQEANMRTKAAEYEIQKQSFLSKNGIPDKTIILEKDEIDSEIHVYENKKIVFLLGKPYDFKDIMTCTFCDNPKTIKGKISAVTKSDNGNVIGRSIVGGVVGGTAGAVIGGSTARRNTEYVQEDDKIIHDYTVIVNINSITNPIIRINTGDNGRLTNEIVGLMKVIISRK